MMHGRQFLDTARLLKLKGEDEAAYRSAISRAYYACFIETRDIASTNRKKAGGMITHDILQRSLKNGGGTQEVKDLGVDLGNFMADRKKADYNMGDTIAVKEAEAAIEFADSFLTDLGKISQKSIGEAMDRYQQILKLS